MLVFWAMTPLAVLAQDKPALGEVTVGVPKSFPPYYLLDEDGNPSGFAVDAMNQVAKRAGFKVTYRVAENGAANFEAIRAGDIDIIPSLGISDHRKQYVAFTEPVDTFRVVLFTRDDTQGITGIDDMAGRPIAVVIDNVGYRFLKKNHPDIQIEVFPTFTEALFALLSAKVDAFAYPEPVTWKLAREAGVADRIKVAAKPLFETKRAMAVRKDDTELLAALDQAVREFIASPEYQEVYVTWFGKPDPYWTVTGVVQASVILSTLLLIAMGAWRYYSVLKLNQDMHKTMAERKLAEVALRESESRFRDLASVASDWFWETDENDCFVHVSDQFFTETQLSPEQLIGKNRKQWVIDSQFEADPEKWRKHFDDVDAHRPFHQMEFALTKADGSTCHVSVSGKPVFDDEGNFKGYRGTDTDITERKKTEMALRESEQSLANAQRIAHMGNWGRNIVTNELHWSDETCRIFGLEPQEFGATYDAFLDSVHPDDRTLVVDAANELIASREHYSIEYRILRPDGAMKFIHVLGEVTYDDDGTPLHVNGTVHDITERKQAENALKESEERFRAVVNNSPTKIHIKDIAGRYILVNRVAEKLFGVTDEEARGKTTDEIFSSSIAADFKRHDQTVLETGQSIEQEEEWHGEGGLRTYITVKFPIFDANGDINGVGAIGTDITARKRAEEALVSAKETAEFANRTKSEFLANMSHELRTPLNAIIGFSDVMKDGMFGPVGNPKYVEYVKDINASGHHLLKLINDILDLSKIEAGKAELYEENIDVSKTLLSCLTLVKERAEEAGVDIAYDAAPDLPALYADERKFKQIFINLLSNAIKFTPRGGKVAIKIWYSTDNGYVLQITDTGIGIALVDIPKALAPFIQMDSDLNRKYEGTGLGLPLTKALAELHGGSLDLQSEVGVGTTVTVRFPAERIVSEMANASTAEQNGASAAE